MDVKVRKLSIAWEFYQGIDNLFERLITSLLSNLSAVSSFDERNAFRKPLGQ